MPSESLRRWNEVRIHALDEIEDAHKSVGGSERGRRYATQQINYAYAAILSAQFQAFCRDLHSESIDYLVTVVPASLQDALKVEFLLNRTLDRGNPHPGGIGSDFNRLGVDFWPEVYLLHASNNRRRELLQRLIDWRNAIAHQDFNPVGGDPTLHLGRVRSWRRAVNALTGCFDRVMGGYLGGLMGRLPGNTMESAMSKQTFQVGQLVAFKYGTRDVQGVVKEDRGPIGMKGRVLFLVEFRPETESPYVSHIELPADRLKKVERAVSTE